MAAPTRFDPLTRITPPRRHEGVASAPGADNLERGRGGRVRLLRRRRVHLLHLKIQICFNFNDMSCDTCLTLPVPRSRGSPRHPQEFAAHTSTVNCLKIGRKSSGVMVTGGDDKKVNLWHGLARLAVPASSLNLSRSAPEATYVIPHITSKMHGLS